MKYRALAWASSVYGLVHIVITVTPKILSIVKIGHDVIGFLKQKRNIENQAW